MEGEETSYSDPHQGKIQKQFTIILVSILFVTVDFTTHGGSHIYGLPCPSANSLDPMDYFCTFDVSKIIPKNTCYFPYMTFNPILTYTRRYNP